MFGGFSCGDFLSNHNFYHLKPRYRWFQMIFVLLTTFSLFLTFRQLDVENLNPSRSFLAWGQTKINSYQFLIFSLLWSLPNDDVRLRWSKFSYSDGSETKKTVSTNPEPRINQLCVIFCYIKVNFSTFEHIFKHILSI